MSECAAFAAGLRFVLETRPPPRSSVGKWTIGGLPLRSARLTIPPPGRVASIEILPVAEGRVAGRGQEARIEQRPQREEQVRFPGARLADERADRPGTQHDPARGPEVDDADLAQEPTHGANSCSRQ